MKSFINKWLILSLIVVCFIMSSTTTVSANSLPSAPTSFLSTKATYKANTLSDIETIVQESMKARQPSVVIQYKGKTDQLLEQISDYIAKTISADEYLNYSYKGASLSYQAYGTDITITLLFSYYESQKEMEYVDKTVKRIVDDIITPTMNIHQKVKAVHDYLVTHLAYDTTLQNNSPYLALTEGTTACNGYAMLAYKMLTELGIETRLISGVATNQSSQSQNHAWNMVNIEGNWYHLDVTWDDPISNASDRILYDYYLLTDQEIAVNHQWQTGGINGEEKPYPVSATTSYFDVLKQKAKTPFASDVYQQLLYSLDTRYLLPSYTTTTMAELEQLIHRNFTAKNNEFSIRYVHMNNDVKEQIKQAIYQNAVKHKVKSWSYQYRPYIRGAIAGDQIITIADVKY